MGPQFTSPKLLSNMAHVTQEDSSFFYWTITIGNPLSASKESDFPRTALASPTDIIETVIYFLLNWCDRLDIFSFASWSDPVVLRSLNGV